MAVVITWRTCLSTIKERGKLRFVIYFEAREMQFQTRVSSFLPTQNRYDPTNSGNKLKPFMEQYFKRTFRSFPLIHFHRRSKMDQDEFPWWIMKELDTQNWTIGRKCRCENWNREDYFTTATISAVLRGNRNNERGQLSLFPKKNHKNVFQNGPIRETMHSKTHFVNSKRTKTPVYTRSLHFFRSVLLELSGKPGYLFLKCDGMKEGVIFVNMTRKKEKKRFGAAGVWTPDFSHAKRALYHWVTAPWILL